MGIFGSKSNISEGGEAVAVESEHHSPSFAKKKDNLKALPLDPRSPSEEIARTPILVEASPSILDSADSNEKYPRTPLSILANRNSKKEKSLSHKMFSRFRARSSGAAKDTSFERGSPYCAIRDTSSVIQAGDTSAVEDKENSDIQ